MNNSLSLRVLPAVLALLAIHGVCADTSPHAYAAHGTIEGIAPDHQQVTIHHQEIPGYMMEMTMDFPVRNESLLTSLKVGDQVDFTLKVTATDSWVDSIHRTGHVDQAPALPPRDSTPSAPKPGDLLPDAIFTSEDNKQVHLSDFRGQVVVLTFFFTRCPLPNYCPLMNRDFAATRKIVRADGKAPKNWQFLSISFDSDFDTPKTLSNYADFYRDHDRDRWLFVSASPATLAQFAAPLGLMIMKQGNSLSHNLRTLVIDPQGRLYHQYNDNLWTADQLAQSVIAAAKVPAKK
jgi:protein SCO1/2